MSHELELIRSEIRSRSRQKRLIWSTIYMIICSVLVCWLVWRVFA